MKKPIRDMDGLRLEFFTEMARVTDYNSRHGWTGWGSKKHHKGFIRRLLSNAERRDWVDVANLAMFLWNLEGRMGK